MKFIFGCTLGKVIPGISREFTLNDMHVNYFTLFIQLFNSPWSAN